MKKNLLNIVLILGFLSSFCVYAQNKVSIVENDNTFQLYNNGNPYYIKGAGAKSNFKQAVESAKLEPCVLLGEGSFHQIHGGVATNVTIEAHPGVAFAEEYQNIRGYAYRSPSYEPFYAGRFHQPARRFMR